MKRHTTNSDNVREKIADLEQRVRSLESRENEIENQLRKLSADALTADNFRGRLQTETVRHDF